MLLEILAFALCTVPLSVQVLQTDHAYVTYLMLQRQLSHSNGSKLDHRQI
jgi:hypothetical protein